DLEAVLVQQSSQGAAAPELDVTAMPLGAMVKVPLVEDRQGEIFPIPMVWGANHEIASVGEETRRVDRQMMRREQVLDDLGRHHDIELLFRFQQALGVILDAEVIKRDTRVSGAGDLDSAFVVLAAGHRVALALQQTAQRAVAGTDV